MILVDDTQDGDYQAPSTAGSTGYEKVPDGVYTIISVIFMSKSVNKATEQPTTVVSSWGAHQVFFSLITAEGKDVPLALDFRNVPYLVEAFTKDAENLLPPVPDLDNLQAVEKYLVQARQLCDTSERKPTITLKGGKGWAKIYNVQGAHLPQTVYITKLEDITSRNSTGLPAPYTQTSTQYPDEEKFNAVIGIHYNQFGKPNGWTGVSLFAGFLPYKLEAVTGENGELVTDWVKYKGGSDMGKLTPKAEELKTFIKGYAPSMFKESFELNEPGNLLPEFLKKSQKDNTYVSIGIEVTKSGYNKLALKTAKEVPSSSLDNGAYVPPPTKTPEVTKEVDHLEVLKMFFNLVEGEFVFPENTTPVFPTTYTPVQIDVLKKHIGPVKSQITDTNKTSELTLQDVNVIMSSANFKDMAPSVMESVVKLSRELEVTGIQIATEEEPF